MAYGLPYVITGELALSVQFAMLYQDAFFRGLGEEYGKLEGEDYNIDLSVLFSEHPLALDFMPADVDSYAFVVSPIWLPASEEGEQPSGLHLKFALRDLAIEDESKQEIAYFATTELNTLTLDTTVPTRLPLVGQAKINLLFNTLRRDVLAALRTHSLIQVNEAGECVTKAMAPLAESTYVEIVRKLESTIAAFAQGEEQTGYLATDDQSTNPKALTQYDYRTQPDSVVD